MGDVGVCSLATGRCDLVLPNRLTPEGWLSSGQCSVEIESRT